MSTPTPLSVLKRSCDRRSLISDGISLALVEVEVGTCIGLTGCAATTDPLDTCIKSVKLEDSKESELLSTAVSEPVMTGFDMTSSSSISGHQRMSLKDGNIMLLVSILVLLLLLLEELIPKDADELDVEEAAATASVAMMMISKERRKKSFAFNFKPKPGGGGM